MTRTTAVNCEPLMLYVPPGIHATSLGCSSFPAFRCSNSGHTPSQAVRSAVSPDHCTPAVLVIPSLHLVLGLPPFYYPDTRAKVYWSKSVDRKINIEITISPFNSTTIDDSQLATVTLTTRTTPTQLSACDSNYRRGSNRSALQKFSYYHSVISKGWKNHTRRALN